MNSFDVLFQNVAVFFKPAILFIFSLHSFMLYAGSSNIELSLKYECGKSVTDTEFNLKTSNCKNPNTSNFLFEKNFADPVHNLTQMTDHPTIQAAINAANPGDVIECDAMIYMEKVTITKSITLQGVNEASCIIDGMGLGTGSGIVINSAVTNVTIQRFTIKNHTGAGPNSYAGIYAIGGNNNLVIMDCTIKDNLGGSGFYANGPVNGVTLDDLDISGHTNVAGAARGIVIWNGLKENITITNCEVYNNNCCGIELQDGTSSAVNMSNNNVHDNWDNGMSAVGLHGSTGSNTIANNVLNNNGRFGIEIKNPDANGSNTSVTGNMVSITGSFVTLRPSEERDLVGIAAFRRGVLADNVDVPTGVTITGNTVSGYVQDNGASTSEGFGIVVEGTNHTVTGNTVNNNDVGIQQQAGHTPYPGDGDQSDLADLYFGRGNSPIACGNTISGNTFSGNGTNTRNNGSVGGTGFVKNTNSGETFCTIQAAINDAETLSGHELIVYGGVFVENVNVTKSLTLKGANNGTNGCSGSRITESRIDGLAGTAVTISANGVTIDGFELLGLTGVSAAGFNDLEIINNKIYTQAVGVQITGMTTSVGNTCLIEKNCIDLVSQVFGGTNTSVGIFISGASGTEKLTMNNNTVTDGFYGYVMHDISTNPKTIISNGTVTGSMQGVALVNTVGGPLGMVDIEIVSMSLTGFSGNYPSLPAQNFHAGIYTFTTATTVPANGIQALIQNCTISGTESLSPSGAGIYLGDFSTGAVTVQNITIDENTISNNLNRGIDSRGYVLATITQNTLTGNGSAPWGAGGNDGYSIIAQRGAVVNVYNNFITHPAASTYPVTAFFTGNTPVNTITANDNSVLMNGNAMGLGANSIIGTGSISAECNWWGVTGTSVPLLMSGTVDYELFLTSGVDDLPGTPGFQPVANSCNGCSNGNSVANINSGEFFCSIQEAINDPQTLNGHVLEVSSGTYNEQVLVNKTLTIKGVGMPKPIVDFTGTVTGKPTLFDVSVDGVTIDNIHFKVDLSKLRSAIIASATGLDNITVKNNMVDAYGTPAGSYGDRNAISINYGGPSNYRVATGGVNSILCQNNTVNGSLPTSFFRSGIAFDEGGGTVTGNTLQTINHDVLVRFSSNGAVTISNNNCNGGGIELADQNAGSGIISVSTNIFTGAGAPNTAVLRVKNNYNGISHVISNNTFNTFNWAVSLENMNNVLLDGNTFNPAAGTTYGVVVNTKSISSNSNTIVQVPIGVIMTNNNFNGAGTGVYFANHDSDNDSYGTLTIGTAGNENNFVATLSSFITMDKQTGSSDFSTFPIYGTGGGWTTTMACWDIDIDVTNNNFDAGAGLQTPMAMSLSNRFALEDKLQHGTDSRCNGFFIAIPNHLYVTDISAAQATDNDYTRIRNAVEKATNNWTINLKGSFDWTEANAATSWSLGNDGVVSPADDYSILIPANRNGITFTAPEGLGTASITGPGDLAAINLEGVLVFDGGDNQNWTISNIEFKEFDLGIGMFNGAGGTDAFNNTTITNNRFDIATDLNTVVAPADVNQNIGIHYSFGTNQTISNNIFNVPGDGISNGTNYSSTVCMQSNTSGGNVYNGLLITGNTTNILNAQSANPQVVLGIWENAHAHSSNITVSNNQFLNLSGSNNPSLNLQRGFRVTSHSSAGTNVIYSGNTVKGANLGFQWIAGSNFSAEQAVQLTGNIVNGNELGVLLQSNGKALFTNNDFDDAVDNTKDIQIQSGSIMTTGGGNQYAGETYYIENLSSTGLDISGETFDQSNSFRRTDRIYGALDNAASGLIRIDGNNLYVSAPGTGASDETIPLAISAANATGESIHVETGSYANGFDGSSKELTLVPGSSPGCVTLGGNLNLTSGDALSMELNGTTVCSLYDQLIVNGTVTLGGSNLILSVGFIPANGNQFKIIDNDGGDAVVGQFTQGAAITSGGYTFDIDYAGGDGNDVVLSKCAAGIVNTNTGEIFCSIQDAINDPQTVNGHTITIAAGTYAENVVVNKELTISGAGKGSNPATNTVITPSISCIGAGFTISAANVTLQNMFITNFQDAVLLSGVTNPTLNNLALIDYCRYGVNFGGNNSDVEISNTDIQRTSLLAGTIGMRIGTANAVNGMLIDNCTITGNALQGIVNFQATTPVAFDNIVIKNSTISNNLQKGMYFEKLSNATFEKLTMDNNGTDATYGFNNGIDINLKYGSYSNITIKDCDITNSGVTGTAIDPQNPAVIAIKARDDAPSYNSIPASLSNVIIKNNKITGPQNAIRIGEFGKINATPSNVTIEGNDLSFAYANKALISRINNDISVNCNWHGTIDLPVILATFEEGSSGDIILSTVLNSGTDASGDVGFQPSGGCICASNNLVTNTTTLETFCSIQEAIDDPQTLNGHTLMVGAGTYVENIIVNKQLTINGPNSNIDPCTGTRGSEAKVFPAIKAISYGEIFHVAASNVTISGFTIDGDNPSLTSGYTSTNGADLDAAEGVTIYETGINNLTVNRNIFKNLSYFGVTLYDYPAAVPSSGHTISQNKFQDFGTYDASSGIDFWGGGVLLYNNQYAWVKDNCMTNLRIGVQTGNFHLANPGTVSFQMIENNTMEVRRRGVFHNLFYGTASPYSMVNNTITGINNANESFWDGILISSQSVTSTATDNSIDGVAIVGKPTEGYEVWNVKNSSPTLINGGLVSNTTIGLFVNNYEGYVSDAGDGAHATVSGITISACSTAVKIFDSPSSTLHAAVSAIIKDDCEINNTGTGTGILVSGTNASATIKDNDASINGFAVGVDIDGASAIVEGNHIYDNGMGVRFTNSGTGTVKTNKFYDTDLNDVDIHATGSAGSVIATPNNWFAGSSFGIENLSGNDIDATLNYWNHTSGPGLIAGGSGAKITTYVIYCPWLGDVPVPFGGTGLPLVSPTVNIDVTETSFGTNNDGMICNGDMVSLDATTTAAISYSWMPGGATTPSITVTPSSTTTFTVTVSFSDCQVVQTQTITVKQSPTFTTCPGSTTVNTDLNECNANVIYTATASGDPTPTYTYSFSGATSGSGAGTGSGSAFLLGVTTVTITAINGCTPDVCLFTITVNDMQNPVPSCESAQTINLNASCQLLVPDLTNGATATDNCSISFTWTQSPTSATLLASGEGTTHTVTVTANDGNGNSATCTVVLTGDDTTAPIPDCENNQTLSLNANCEITVPDKTNAATATDNCSISFTWTQNPLQGAMLPSGEGMMHVVTVTVSDGNGNSSTCTSVLTGNDNTNPVPSCETAQTINLNASCQLLVPDLTDGATATDNCSTTFTWTQSPTSATLLASGEGTTHTVTVTANDGNGNSATCTVVLTGNDNTNPVPSCETAQTINLNSSCQMLVPDLTDGTTATDNCSTTFTWTQNPTSATLLASGEGTTHTVTVTANDGNGNSATCTVVLTGNDNTNPVPSCETAQTINLNSSCQLLVPDLTDAATATDNCSTTFTWTQNPTSATLLASGEGTTHTVTVTANDGNGNSATCTVVLTGNDNTNPVPSCETAQTININSSCQLLVPDLTDGATATDNCSTTFTWTQSPTSATLLASGEGTTHTVTVTANDGNGNSATCTVVLTGNDNTNPVPSCESAQTINLNASCQLLVPDLTDGASATDNCSTTLSWSQSPTTSTLLASGEGTTHTVTVTANDGNGNSATCTVVLTGNDNTNPVPSCESAQTINLNSSCQLLVPDLTDGASATDNCSTTLSWSQSPTTSTLLASGEGTTHTVTVTANDGNGNSATCTVVLTGNDNTNPVPSCESAQTINLNSSCQLLVPDLTDGASATDNCSTTFTWSQSPTSSTLLASGEGTTHTVTVTANDGNGNSATCTVVLTGNDNTNPVPSCESAQTINLNSSCQLLVPDLTDGATATDNCSTTFTWSQSPTISTLLASGEGTTHTVTVTANDGNGNSATCTVVLTGNDNTNPVPICEPAQTIVLNATCQLLVPNLTDGATATDNCATTFTWSQSPTSGSLLASGEGTTHTVTVTASDGNGNSATCTVVLSGNDNTAPVPVCEDPQNVNLNANCQLLVPNLTDGSMATDNCVTTFNWSQNPNAGSILSSAHNLSHTITITVSDGNGNSSTCTTVLTGKDVTMPVMTCPGNQVRGMTEGLCRYVVQGSEFDGTASDNCGIITKTYTLTGIESGTGSGSLAGLYWKKGITTVKWVVTDAAGNTKSCSFIVNVKDLEPPTVTCPPDLIIITLPGQCSVPAGSVSLGTPTVSDNCGIKYPITNNSPSSYPVGVTNVKWTVKDSSNNVKTCIQKVTVVAYTCGQPVTVYHHDTTYSSAKVSWSAGTCASSYQLRIRKEISAGVWTSWSSWVNSSGPLTHLFNGLDDGSFYHYQIRSKCGTGNSNLVNGWFHTLTLPPLKKQDNGFTEFKKVEELDNTELYIKSSEAPELKAVPNPAKDLVSIQLNGFSFATKSLTMTDMFGKLIFNVILDKSENELELDLKQLNVKAGIHFIRVSDGVNQKTIQLLVVL